MKSPNHTAKVAIYCGQSWEEWSPKQQEKGMGGSEEAVVELARLLAKQYEVTVFNRCGDDEGTYDGVKYENFEYFEGDFDYIILWRNADYLLKELKDTKGKKILWLHDCNPEHSILPFIHMVDKIVVSSTYHRGLYPNITSDKFLVTPNGIKTEYFDQKVERNPYKVIYASSYDRGLKELLECWGEVKLAVSEAELHVYYGWDTINKMIESGDTKYTEFKEYMDNLMSQEGVFHHGRIGHKELAKEYLSSGVWAYPCWFPEVLCLAATKAQIAGTIPVVCPTSALRTTVRWGYTTNEPRNEMGSMPWGTQMTPEMQDKFTQLVIKALTNPFNREQMMKDARNKFSVETMASEWIKMMEAL